MMMMMDSNGHNNNSEYENNEANDVWHLDIGVHETVMR